MLSSIMYSVILAVLLNDNNSNGILLSPIGVIVPLLVTVIISESCPLSQ
jgi:hypothetical protein